MRMRARVRAVVWIDLDDEVPEMEFDESPGRRAGSVVHRATNEDEVLEARIGAAKSAELRAEQLFDGYEGVEIVVEEVVER